jgi:hypothetical protein
VCCKNTVVLKSVDPAAVVGVVDWKADCDVESTYSVLCAMPFMREYSVQNDCQHNQLLAAVNRVACSWNQPFGPGMLELKKVGCDLSRHLGSREPVPFEVWGAKYTGMKRARYLRALESLRNIPISRRDGVIQAFVKLEKLADPNKDPRMIQARSARFNIELGNYLKAFEHDLYNIKGEGLMGRWLPKGRSIVKGMNAIARGALIEKHWSSLTNPVQLALDCSRFDGHVNESMLRFEHGVYERLFNYDPYLQRLLAYQRRNVCYTKCGLRYVVNGRRMSGDMNTALGNCVLMICMMAVAMKRLGLNPSQWRMADDGDDCCLMVEADIQHKVVNGIAAIFREFGQELKVESIATSLEQVSLCGAKPVRVCGKRTMILDPKRAIGKTRVGIKSRNQKFIADYVSTIGVGLLALHSGVPVLQAHALALKKASKTHLRELPGAYLYRLAYMEDPFAVVERPITLEARLDFAVSFGVDISAQLELEAWFNLVSGEQILGLAPPMEVPGDNYDCVRS